MFGTANKECEYQRQHDRDSEHMQQEMTNRPYYTDDGYNHHTNVMYDEPKCTASADGSYMGGK